MVGGFGRVWMGSELVVGRGFMGCRGTAGGVQ